MHKCLGVVLALTFLAASPALAQSTDDLLKLSASLNDICRDGASTKTEEACDSRDLVDQILKKRNVCFGELGKVQPCSSQSDGGSQNREGDVSSDPGRSTATQVEQCQRVAENEIVEVKGFLVEFEYAAEETKPTMVTAVVPDKPLCFAQDEATRLRILMLDVKSTRLLGRHAHIEMRIIAGDSWSGSVRAISADKEIPE